MSTRWKLMFRAAAIGYSTTTAIVTTAGAKSRSENASGPRSHRAPRPAAGPDPIACACVVTPRPVPPSAGPPGSSVALLALQVHQRVLHVLRDLLDRLVLDDHALRLRRHDRDELVRLRLQPVRDVAHRAF